MTLSREDFERICDEVYEEDRRSTLATGMCRNGHEQNAAILERICAHVGAQS